MVMRRWDPFNELRRMQENMDHLWHGIAQAPAETQREAWPIPLDMVQDGENVVVHASLPGVNPSDLDVTIEEDVLTIRGKTGDATEERQGNYLVQERHTGSFSRSLRLPQTLDLEKATSKYDQGVLSISFPKMEARKARRLSISVGDAPRTAEEEEATA